MSVEQATSILIQIGAGAFVLGILYGLQSLMNGFDADGREEMERMNAARRLVQQEQVVRLKRKDLEGAPLFSSNFEFIEKALMKDARTKVGWKSIPKALDQSFSAEKGETCQLGTFEATYLQWDRLVLTLNEESLR
ncbi:MAG: hypothetical protein KAR65_09355 [Anaerolineales bacterium]|nr:hypothetical protein [Anaerolineales bacterium]